MKLWPASDFTASDLISKSTSESTSNVYLKVYPRDCLWVCLQACLWAQCRYKNMYAPANTKHCTAAMGISTWGPKWAITSALSDNAAFL